MNAQQLLQWIEILKLCGYGHWEAEAMIQQHLEGKIPAELGHHTLPDDDVQFDLGGSD